MNDMKYWLIAIPREAMNLCLEKGIFGRKHKSKLLDVLIEDRIACYVTRESKIIALGRVNRTYYLDHTKVFPSDKKELFQSREPCLFEHRIGFMATMLEQEVDFKALIPQLEFIKQPDYWPAYIRRGFAEITEKDWQIISTAAREGSGLGKSVN